MFGSTGPMYSRDQLYDKPAGVYRLKSGGYAGTNKRDTGWQNKGMRGKQTQIITWGSQPKAAAAPAPKPAPKPKAAPKPAPVKTPENPYKKQADDLLKTIDKILAKPAPPPPKPVTIFGGSTALSGGDLQIAPANKATKNTGTGGFKRRKTAGAAANTLRTVQSLNV